MKNNIINEFFMKGIVGLMLFSLVFVAPTVAFGENLVPNADLETVDTVDSTIPSSWFKGYIFPNTTTTTYSYPVSDAQGGKAAQVTIDSSDVNADAKWYFSEVPVTGNAEYKFSDDYISTSGTEITVEFLDENHVQLPSPYGFFGFFSIPASAPDTWTPATVSFVAPQDAHFATVLHTIKNGTLTVDNYSLTEVPSESFHKGVVTFAFDDGWDSQFKNGVQLLNTAKIPGSFYIISGAMTRPEDGYATSSELLAIQNSGHEIGSHTVNHCNLATGHCPDDSINPGAPDTLTVNQEINDSRLQLTNIGASPVDTFAYPYGGYISPATIDIVSAGGYIAARTVDEGYNNKNSNPFALKTKIVDRLVTEGNINDVEDWIDTAIANREWIILTFHQIESASEIASNNDSGATTPQFFNQIVNYVKAKRDADQIVVKTMHDAMVDCMGSDESACVNDDITPPVINPVSNITVEATSATGAVVNYDLPVSTDPISCTPNTGSTFAIGTTSVHCVSTDTAGNSSTADFIVTVTDTTAPVITLTGTNPQGITVGTTYVEQGATASDAVSGDVTSSVVIDASSVNTNVAGTYTVTYSNAVDGVGNHATTKTRTVEVASRAITLTADSKSKIAGAADPVLTYSITSGSLLSGDVITGTPSRIAGEDAGTYEITVGSLFAGSNYAVSFVPSTLTITAPVVNTSTGGSHGGGSSSSKKKTETPAVATTTAIGGTIEPQEFVLGVSTDSSSQFIFTSDFGFGTKNNDVLELQKRLGQEGIYFGPVTGYFGALTLDAVKKYQAKNGVVQTGYVGQLTRAKLNVRKTDLPSDIESLQALLANLQAQLKALLDAQAQH